MPTGRRNASAISGKIMGKAKYDFFYCSFHRQRSSIAILEMQVRCQCVNFKLLILKYLRGVERVAPCKDDRWGENCSAQQLVQTGHFCDLQHGYLKLPLPRARWRGVLCGA